MEATSPTVFAKSKIGRFAYFLQLKLPLPKIKDGVNLMSDFGTCLLWLSLGTVKKGPENTPGMRICKGEGNLASSS